jgi:putative transposase
VWGEERIANELLIKLGIRVSPRTLGKYMPERPPGQPLGDQCWATFLRIHARAILACDFFVVIEHGRRRFAHVSVTNHPTADWTLQQMREGVGEGSTYRYLIHDRDSIFATRFDNSVRALGLKVLRICVLAPRLAAPSCI